MGFSVRSLGFEILVFLTSGLGFLSWIWSLEFVV